MDKYEVDIFWSEQDGCYLARMPELPGCMADGASQEEALRNVRIVAEEWVAMARELGREVPTPERQALTA